MRFTDLGLAEPILRAVEAEGYVTPTPIQVKAMPHVLRGSDLLGCAQTGTGKTAAFALPILHRLSQSKPLRADHPAANSRNQASRPIRALILAPTRELAAQIADSFVTYGRGLSLRHTVVFGGVSQHHQVQALRRGVDVLIATPGRLLDLMNQGHIDLRSINILVLDEADRMLDMGFIHDIRTIVARLPKSPQRQTLMFSATMPSDIRKLADSILHKPQYVQATPESSTVEAIEQSVYFIGVKSKPSLLIHLLKNGASPRGAARTLVFTRTKHGADKVVKHLSRAGIRAAAIHGNKSQNARTRALETFKSSAPPVLVATDIASRGIDVDDITHVINFDIPNVPETYVHRIGRTGRAGASGIAISFCDPAERDSLRAIERLTRTTIEVASVRPELLPQLPPTTHNVAERDGRGRDSREHGGGRGRNRHRPDHSRSAPGKPFAKKSHPHAAVRPHATVASSASPHQPKTRKRRTFGHYAR